MLYRAVRFERAFKEELMMVGRVALCQMEAEEFRYSQPPTWFCMVTSSASFQMPTPSTMSCRGKVGFSHFKLNIGHFVLVGTCQLPHSWCPPCLCRGSLTLPLADVFPLYFFAFNSLYQQHKLEQNFFTIYPKMPTGRKNGILKLQHC